MKEEKFFQSPLTGQVMLELSNPYMDQLQDGLVRLMPNSAQASVAHHMPTLRYADRVLYVRVGEQPHPMTEEHHIQWIYIQAELGGQFQMLSPGAQAEAAFFVARDWVYGVYAYCNRHGLWRLDVGNVVSFADIERPPAQADKPGADGGPAE